MTASTRQIRQFRVEVLVRTLYSVGALYLIAVTMRHLSTPVKPLALGIILVIGTGLCLLGVAVQRGRLSYRPAARCFLALMLSTIMLMLVFGSGFRGPVTAVIILVPIYAAFFLGSRESYYYAGLSVATLVMAWTLDLAGWIPSNPLNSQQYLDAKLIVFIAIIVGSQIVVAAWENNRQRTQRYLAQLNRELKQSRKELEQSLEIKSRFLANMSHEVRTPLNGIIGMTTLLLEEQQRPQDRKRLETVSASAETLLALCNNILDASKLESGQMTLEQQPFSPVDETRKVIAMLETQIEDAGIDVSLRVGAVVPGLITGDHLRFNQVIINLVSNAIKFSNGKDVRIELDASTDDDYEYQVTVRVFDQGIGISPEAAARLFQPFVQADLSTTRKYGGSGLGLSIVQNIADLMHGEISVESEEGKGSVFTFSFPAMLADEGPVKHSARGGQLANGQASDRHGFKPLRILVAEDNETNRTIVEAFLGRLGHEAEYVFTGAEACDAVRNNRYDLVLMDCHMPDVDGYEATREIVRELGSNRPGIIALTATDQARDRQMCQDAGMDGFISKPLRLNDLEQTLNSWRSLKSGSHAQQSHGPVSGPG